MRNLREFGFGQHLTLDAYGCQRDQLESMERIYKFLDECPDQIYMTKIMPPYVFKYNGIKPEDWGVSGFVLIAESHISIHTFPEKSYLSLDIFSCKEFNVPKTIKYLEQFFSLESYEHRLLNRGSEFPKRVMLAKELVTEDRLHLVGTAD